MKKVVALLPVEDFWGPFLTAVCCMVLVVGLLTFKLGTLTPGFTDAEVQQRTSAATLEVIRENPLHVHQKIGQFALLQLGNKGPAAMRITSAFVGFTAIVCMFIILKNWYTPRIAVLGTFLFATSSWLLHASRMATPDINFTLPLLLFVGGIWLHQRKFIMFAAVLTFATAVLLIYIPGMVWLLIPAIVWQRKLLRHTFRHLNPSQQMGVTLIAIVGLAPLTWALAFDRGLIATWLGLPEVWPGPLTYIKNIALVPIEIFFRGPNDPVYGIGRLPILDAFTGFMVCLGLFASFFHLSLDRTKIIIGTVVVGTLLIALDGPVKIAVLIPVVYLLAVAGIALLLQQWFTVFPRNPVARTLGVLLVSAAVLLSSYYHISRYFIAWPNVPATKAVFNERP